MSQQTARIAWVFFGAVLAGAAAYAAMYYPGARRDAQMTSERPSVGTTPRTTGTLVP
jgi:hypothetical protein